jgi:glucose-6-phosphate-specific signal transduction histidine kinase
MMLPGLISVAFYKRRPPWSQVVLGLVVTVALSAVLGYPFVGNPLSHGGPIVGPLLGAISGAVLYLVIVAIIFYHYWGRFRPRAGGGAPLKSE